MHVGVVESPSKESLTGKHSEDSSAAGLHSKQLPSDRLIVESDGPESDKPETTASMGKPQSLKVQLVLCVLHVCFDILHACSINV